MRQLIPLNWAGIQKKARLLEQTDNYRKQHAMLQLKLNKDAYVEHSDCAERNFYEKTQPTFELFPTQESLDYM